MIDNGFFDEEIPQSEVHQDPVYGKIELNQVCQAITKTEQFLRLFSIEELGLNHFVHQGAAYTTYEHSIGVCYMAGCLARTLKINQPSLGITDKDVMCLEVAGLCHDLGKTPFHPNFLNLFITHGNAKLQDLSLNITMFDHLVHENLLNQEDSIFTMYDIDESDLDFIKLLITGVDTTRVLENKLAERSKGKEFMFQIVKNKRNCIDVDTIDSYVRYCHHLGKKKKFNYRRFLESARVINIGGKLEICYADEEIGCLYNLFDIRRSLYKAVFYHDVHCALELMLTTALNLSHDHIFLDEEKGYKLSDSYKSMAAFTLLNDNVIFKILYSDNKHANVQEAKQIVNKILNRELYRCILECKINEESEQSTERQSEYTSEILNLAKEEKQKFCEKNISVQVKLLNFDFNGMSSVTQIFFYSGTNMSEVRNMSQNEVALVLSSLHNPYYIIRVYVCSVDAEDCETVKRAAYKWCQGRRDLTAI